MLNKKFQVVNGRWHILPQMACWAAASRMFSTKWYVFFFLSSDILLTVFRRFSKGYTIRVLGGLAFTLMMRHSSIIVTVRDDLAPPHCPAGGPGSVPNHFWGQYGEFLCLLSVFFVQMD